ncbi:MULTISPECIES: proline--tRNA ligase [unclassified Halanaerobium]|uniref:proline--tRNA ligase n=1 Tax=unclassified Halanaerobium TaxID=2641197 RepID=UPI000DF1FA35|nr:MULTISPECIES: proline--tRNA ligase [unclassified Halanaerobium]RCW47372.1 prolyl-tRNA synthetase [Halanaerobium sp. MA284_MarDTE_T2]RCW84911.1 prolyl-tRNA synthetase [Halanaerobium sp. DL-01]
MKMSKMYIPTLKETPADAEIVSHQLMLRAGLMRKLTSGIYTYLPLGYNVIRKFEQIVREEMNRAGAQELLMPALQPAALWKESKRFDDYGPELMKLKDRHNRDFCLGPTHEEVVTDLVRDEIRSYKDLPLNLYQIQTKYRDEIRPRFGVLRGREFIMKDAYSFDRDQAGLDQSYQKMYDAYCKIYDRCGLKYRTILADSGPIGGDNSHEFMVLAEVGEDTIVYCDSCDYAANLDLAESVLDLKEETAGDAELSAVSTPAAKTIDQVAEFLELEIKQIVKSVLYETQRGEIVLALIRGDYEVNEVKLANLLGVVNLELAGDQVYEELNTVKGFTGPVNIGEVKIIADHSVSKIVDGVIGANEADQHFIHFNFSRDLDLEETFDIRKVKEGEECVHCGGKLKFAEGIEVGQIFKLGTKYSEVFNATYLDEDGKSQMMEMGCYGIGITRTIAAAIEQNYDEYGIKWPLALAPYQVHLLQLGESEEVIAKTEDLYKQLNNEGIEVLLDDRNERAGVKFNDADLIGCPIRITIGERSLSAGKLEVKYRQTGKEFTISTGDETAKIKELLADLS